MDPLTPKPSLIMTALGFVLVTTLIFGGGTLLFLVVSSLALWMMGK